MTIDIGQYLEHMLWQSGRVSLPGVGTIFMDHVSAHLEKSKSEIYPPRVKFSFSSKVFDARELSNLISQNEELDTTIAEETIIKFSEKILNTLLNYGIVKVANIGYLEKEEGKTVFTPAENTMSKVYTGLKPVRVSSNKKMVIASTTEMIKTNSEKVDQKFIQDVIDYLASFILGGLLIFMFQYFMDPLGTKQETNSSSEIELYQNKIGELKELKKKYPVTDSIEFIDNEKTADVRNKSDFGILEEPTIIGDLQDTHIVQDNLRRDQTLAIATQNELSDFSDKDKKMSNRRNEDSAAINLAKPKEDQECIILVGVYTKTYDALLMVDKVKSAGYKAYRDEKYDTHRVGVQFRCGDHSPETMIKEIRKKFGVESRYLYPQLSL